MPRVRPALLLALALALAGCRLDTAPDAAPPDARPVTAADTAGRGGGLAAAGPPVAAGDTARVTPRRAGRGTGPADVTLGPSGLAVPVVGVDPGDLVDTFEQARGEGRVHDAIDILAPRGTPVVAVASGRVLRLFTSERGGLTVYQLGDAPLADGRRPVYYYAHLDAYAPGLAAGQRLGRGGAVGTVGDSGNAAPGNTHLHFAVWTVADTTDFWDGDAVNPYDLLAGR